MYNYLQSYILIFNQMSKNMTKIVYVPSQEKFTYLFCTVIFNKKILCTVFLL